MNPEIFTVLFQGAGISIEAPKDLSWTISSKFVGACPQSIVHLENTDLITLGLPSDKGYVRIVCGELRRYKFEVKSITRGGQDCVLITILRQKRLLFF